MQQWSPGDSGQETCGHALQEPGELGESFRTHLAWRVPSHPQAGPGASGQDRGPGTQGEEPGPQCPVECRNRLAIQQSKTRALEASGGRCPGGVGWVASSFSLTLGKEALTGPSEHLLLLPPGHVQKRPVHLPAVCGPRLLRAPIRADS